MMLSSTQVTMTVKKEVTCDCCFTNLISVVDIGIGDSILYTYIWEGFEEVAVQLFWKTHQETTLFLYALWIKNKAFERFLKCSKVIVKFCLCKVCCISWYSGSRKQVFEGDIFFFTTCVSPLCPWGWGF